MKIPNYQRLNPSRTLKHQHLTSKRKTFHMLEVTANHQTHEEYHHPLGVSHRERVTQDRRGDFFRKGNNQVYKSKRSGERERQTDGISAEETILHPDRSQRDHIRPTGQLGKHPDQVMSVMSFQTLLLMALALPAISAYTDIRAGALDEDGEDDWTRDASLQDLEAYKLLYDLANTVQRPSRHADGLFTSGYSKLLGQLSAKEYLESLLAKRVSDELAQDQTPVKRHSDAVFTDNYSRYRKQMAAKKYLNSVLAGKRR
ncbi:unnamed protein product [Leuciscus chuanchicus]